MASGAQSGAALARAKTAHEAGDLRKADRLYRRILRRNPDNAAALNLYGILASQRGDSKRAVQRLQRAVAVDGDTLDYRVNLGIVLESAKNFAAAYDHYVFALERDPRNQNLLSRISEAAREGNRHDDFALLLQTLCADHPDYAEAHFLLGLARYILHRPGEAVEPLRRATALAPNFIQAHANLASVLMDLGRPDEALASCSDCLRLNPGDSYALATQAIAFVETDAPARARQLLDSDALLEVHTLTPPPGFSDISAFNDELEAAVMAHPSLRVDPNHRSCHFASQTDDLFQEAVEPFASLHTLVKGAADKYRRKLDPSATHPFLKNPVPRTELIGWATTMRAQGHQSAHIHPTSWLSAVYYVRVPDLVQRGDNAHKGWIEFGRPPEHYPITKEPDVTFVEPVEGKLILFPSYFYHRTVPYEDDALRISIAFDFDPTFAE
jgi:uncharacterized protein (TIGR02466 family)